MKRAEALSRIGVIVILLLVSVVCTAGAQGNLTVVYHDGSYQTMHLNHPPSNIKSVNISAGSQIHGRVPDVAGQWKEIGGGCSGTIWNIAQVGEKVVSISAFGQCPGGSYQVWDGTNFQWVSGNVLAFKIIYKNNPWGWRDNNLRVTFSSNNRAIIEWRLDDGRSGSLALER